MGVRQDRSAPSHSQRCGEVRDDEVRSRQPDSRREVPARSHLYYLAVGLVEMLAIAMVCGAARGP